MPHTDLQVNPFVPPLNAQIIDIGDDFMLGLCDDGRKIWLDGPAVPGDRVLFEMTGKTGNIVEITETAAERRPAFCAHFDHCPGCQLQPLPYSRQLELKTAKIVEALRRLGGFSDIPMLGVVPSPQETGSRNKLDFSIEAGNLGYQSRRGFLPITDCPAGDPLLRKFIPAAQAWLQAHPRHQLHRLILRCNGARNAVHLLLRGRLEEAEEASWRDWAAQHPEISGLSIQEDWQRDWETFYGAPHLDFSLADVPQPIDHDGFFQVNDLLADQLVRETLAWMDEGPKNRLLDLFCGAGAFTLPAAALGFQVLGLDARPGKGPFQRADLRKGIPKVVANQSWQTVLTDPPRAGMDKKLCEEIRDKIRPERIFYISCNPATLARDLKIICATGKYQICRVKGFDLFPQTTHVETLVELNF